MAANDTQGTVPLSDLDDFKVADGAPDVRGWEVKSDDGRKVGKVTELLVSPTERRVRYLCVKLDRDVGGGKDREVLVPVGVARLDDKHDDVLIPASAVSSFQTLGDYRGGALTRDYEKTLRDSYGSGATAAAGASMGSNDFYAHDHFDENRFFGKRHAAKGDEERRLVRTEEELAVGKRQVQAGEVSVHKHVEHEKVRQNVPVTHEEVTVERRPITDATAAMHGKPTITDDEIVVPVTEEEVVVQKRAVPKEEVVIRKHAVTENKEVEADVRRERIDVDDTTHQTGAGRTGSTGATGSTRGDDRSLGQKAADKLDDLKDRVDGNPRSRPGPDATDSNRRL